MIDLGTPTGISVWLLHPVPLMLTVTVRSGPTLVSAAWVFSVLTILGAFVSPAGRPVLMALINRALSVSILWGVA